MWVFFFLVKCPNWLTTSNFHKAHGKKPTGVGYTFDMTSVPFVVFFFCIKDQLLEQRIEVLVSSILAFEGLDDL